ncbi:hypothetical protein LTR10_023907 [Elasticomyces elasticus]|uniref:AGC-kinase C-terminal domain-containing protein n=1 Tax=Exophiala sideris TaxID=1016849 RepID=A0ABR0IUA9_9EURO|nr:hypothetical protein LTR10_023907 [Elasticomyces elasticus]KAK5020883.1 hypothetical protein LTS07_011385 [Exophiala sideris]KAK5023008.1 hypothetical protein LTR13_011354 [Exophiala sideris]KAK5048405.1 hypothetical protein LTR69_011393 [Exophiala sideris]KAK5176089.1 hypothetical protein LTR44_011364 [Eurotiomycetes sp. CCFEE 6388]
MKDAKGQAKTRADEQDACTQAFLEFSAIFKPRQIELPNFDFIRAARWDTFAERPEDALLNKEDELDNITTHENDTQQGLFPSG